jgi:ribosomal protein S12
VSLHGRRVKDLSGIFYKVIDLMHEISFTIVISHARGALREEL